MKDLFKVINLKIKDKAGNLKSEAHSQVKSTKYFPVYQIEGKNYIFKPLSKTKPLTTPFFAYSEVYWSYIIKKYFDESAPRYRLAICKGMEEEQNKYYDKGVLVESIIQHDEKLMNLYDYFLENPEEQVNIKNYINYCMKNYDYTNILSSNFIKNNREIGEKISYQILLSTLRQDRNFHYENVNFILKNNEIDVAPPIDFEFSLPFLYPDDENNYNSEKNKYYSSIEIKLENDETIKILKMLGIKANSIVKENLIFIIKNYPNVVETFIEKLDCLVKDLPNIIIDDPDEYIGELNSDYWELGNALYKENDLKKYNELKSDIKLKKIDKKRTFEKISTDILEYSKLLKSVLTKYLFAHLSGMENLQDATIKDILQTLNISNEELEKRISNIENEKKR